jgi:hypothetical protein
MPVLAVLVITNQFTIKILAKFLAHLCILDAKALQNQCRSMMPRRATSLIVEEKGLALLDAPASGIEHRCRRLVGNPAPWGQFHKAIGADARPLAPAPFLVHFGLPAPL